MAAIAVRTLDLDRLATELEARVDYGAWSARLASAVTAPLPTTATRGDDNGPTSVSTGGGLGVDTEPRRVSGRRRGSTAERVARVLARNPGARPAEVAARLGVSERTVQRYWPTSNGHGAA
jgi:hypothetical protein